MTNGPARVTRRVLAAAFVAATTVRAQQLPPDSVAATGRYAAVARALDGFIRHEMTDKQLPALSIALVDDQSIVWARGFGYANPRDSVPATAGTVYRVGSISKLFTDLGVMQLVERGQLSLDTAVRRYMPDFAPRGPGASSISLRQLMAHRAGLVREPPLGHYFDSTSQSLAATVRSMNRTALVYAPGARTKYSNAGIAVAGYVLEATQKEPFSQYLARTLLRPMGLHDSAFEPDSVLR